MRAGFALPGGKPAFGVSHRLHHLARATIEERSVAWRVRLAVIASFIASLVSYALPDPHLNPVMLAQVVAVFLVSLFAGLGAGLLTSVLCLLGIAAMLHPGADALDQGMNIARLALLGSVELLVCVFTAVLRERNIAMVEGSVRLNLIEESAGVGLWEWSIEQQQMLLSEGAARVYGSEQRTSSIEEFFQLVFPEDVEKIREAVRQSLRTGQDYDVEYRIRRADHRVRWVSARGVVVRDDEGRPNRIVGIIVDITHRRRQDTQLLRSEERLRTALDAARLAGWEWDIRSGYLRWFGHLQDIFGTDAVGPRVEDFRAFIHPDDRDMVFGKVEEARQHGSVFTAQYRIVRADQSVAWVLTRGQFVQYRGQVIRMYGVVMDITQQRRSEASLRQNEKLAAAGRLAATLAHEINNPLSAVTNALFLLAANPALDTAAQQQLTIARNELARVVNITRQTLGFYRESVAPVQVSLVQIVKDVNFLYSRKLQNAGITVKIQDEGTPPITAFPGEVRQVIANLFSNALDAMPQGGTVHLRICKRRLFDHEGISLLYSDNGPGIPQPHLRNLTQPFYTTKGEKGTGLGLWVSRGIVNRHGGSLHIWSSTRPGHSGAYFRIFLPLAPPSELRYDGPATLAA